MLCVQLYRKMVYCVKKRQVNAEEEFNMAGLIDSINEIAKTIESNIKKGKMYLMNFAIK